MPCKSHSEIVQLCIVHTYYLQRKIMIFNEISAAAPYNYYLSTRAQIICIQHAMANNEFEIKNPVVLLPNLIIIVGSRK